MVKQQLLKFATKAAKLPLAAIIYTDITKDGMMTGPNLERTKALVQAVQLPEWTFDTSPDFCGSHAKRAPEI